MSHKEALSLGGHYVTVRGVKLWYFVQGQGPVLLLQPGGAGWGGDITPYIETLKPLEKVRTVIYLEPRGMGRSQRLSDSAAYSMEEYVKDIEAFRKHIQAPKIAIAGHSHGGFIALQYAARYPQRIERLLLLNTTPHILLGDEESWLKQRQSYHKTVSALKKLEENETITEDEKTKSMLQIWLPVTHFFDYEKVSSKVDRLLSAMSVSSEPHKYFSEHEARTYDVRGLLGSITAPTLIVVGDDEMPCVEIGSRLLREGIPNSNLVIIEKCGHWPMIEAPEAFFKAVTPYLSKS